MPTNFVLKEEGVGKGLQKYLLKVRDCNVSLYQNAIIHYKSLKTIYALLSNFESVDLRAFSACPAESAVQIFTFAPPHPAPPCGFLSSPRLALLENATPCASLVPSSLDIHVFYGHWSKTMYGWCQGVLFSGEDKCYLVAQRRIGWGGWACPNFGANWIW